MRGVVESVVDPSFLSHPQSLATLENPRAIAGEPRLNLRNKPARHGRISARPDRMVADEGAAGNRDRRGARGENPEHVDTPSLAPAAVRHIAGAGVNKAGAAYGTGYCDSQCPRDLKFINGQVSFDESQK